MNKTLLRLAGQAAAILTAGKGIRRARAEGDTLRLVEAVVHIAAVVLTVAIIVRELRETDDVSTALESSTP